MVKDLFFPLEIRVMPIVREADGLAKSSRNVYLNKAERSAAVILSKALAKAKAAFEAGERDSAKLIALVTEMIQTEPLSNIDYVEMYQLPDLTPAEKTEIEMSGTEKTDWGNWISKKILAKTDS